MPIGGRDTTFKHGTFGALTTLTDFTTKTMEVNPSFNAEEADATVFGDGFRSYESTFKNATISVKYKYDATLFGQLAAIYTNGSTVDWEIGPVGTDSGNPQIEGSMCMTSFNPPYTVGTVQVIDVTYRVTGEVTFGTF